MAIKKGEEYFGDYGYHMDFAPKWYRNLYRDYAKEHPDDADMDILDHIAKVEAELSEY